MIGNRAGLTNIDVETSSDVAAAIAAHNINASAHSNINVLGSVVLLDPMATPSAATIDAAYLAKTGRAAVNGNIAMFDDSSFAACELIIRRAGHWMAADVIGEYS